MVERQSSERGQRPTLLLLHYMVQDAGAWRNVFDAHQPARRRHGSTGHRVWRFTRDPNNLMVGLEFPSPEAADRYLEDPALLEVMAEAGVAGPASIFLLEPVEDRRYTD
jgi:hypothetical protein